MSFDRLSSAPEGGLPSLFHVIVEIPAHSSPVKYEVDKDSQCLFVDRFLNVAMRYPLNYGYIPGTMSDDGDPLDVLVMTPTPVIHGCVLLCRPLGVLNMEDESGYDAKIIAVPRSKCAPMYDNIQSLDDISSALKDELVHFFEHYKDLEKNKWVKVSGWAGKEEAEKIILASVK